MSVYRQHAIPQEFSRLAASVDAFWSFEGQGSPHRVLPDGCMDILFELESGRVRVVGPMTRAELVPLQPGERLFGARFRPGRAALMIDTAAHELANCDIPATDLLGARARQLADAVCSAAGHDARARVLATFIADPNARRSVPDPRVDRAVKLIDASAGAVPIGAVAQAAGLGERQLERLFRERVGLRPKLLARIIRMQRTVELAAGRHTTRQAELAALGGYADEPHLVREFHALCGASPAQIRRELDVGFVQDAPADCGSDSRA